MALWSRTAFLLLDPKESAAISQAAEAGVHLRQQACPVEGVLGQEDPGRGPGWGPAEEHSC